MQMFWNSNVIWIMDYIVVWFVTYLCIFIPIRQFFTNLFPDINKFDLLMFLVFGCSVFGWLLYLCQRMLMTVFCFIWIWHLAGFALPNEVWSNFQIIKKFVKNMIIIDINFVKGQIVVKRVWLILLLLCQNRNKYAPYEIIHKTFLVIPFRKNLYLNFS